MVATLTESTAVGTGDTFAVTLERGALLTALTHAQSIAERRNTVQILGNVLIQVEADRVLFSATDMDMDLLEAVAVLGGTPGATTVPVQLFYELVRKLPDDTTVTLVARGDQLLLNAGKARNYQLSTLPAQDFPRLSTGHFPHQFTIAGTVLNRLFNKTKIAMSTEEMRYYLNGVYFHATEGRVRMVSTDGHRLALAEAPAPPGVEALPGIIIPRKTVQELSRLLADYSDEVTIALSPSKVRFSFGPIALTSKLIDGTYPDYTRVIPRENPGILKVPTAVLCAAADRIATLAAEKIRGVRFVISQDSLRLSAGGQSALGSGVEDVAAEYSGPEADLGFSARYLLDALSNIDGKTITLSLRDVNTAVLVEDVENQDYLFVLMPMSL